MNTMDMLTYRNGTKTQRQIRILTQGSDTLVVDFCEFSGHRFVSKYYILLETGDLTSIKFNSVMRGWLEYNEELFNHPHLTIADDE
jgi:hypothetical protein